MIPLRYVFRSRWAALFWAGGILWTAVSFAGGDAHHVDPGSNAIAGNISDNGVAQADALATAMGLR